MYIGVITNYGGKNGYGNFGFIRPLGTRFSDDIFFHNNAVKKNSRLNLAISAGRANGKYVVYDIDDEIIPGKNRKAKVLCLVNELSPEEVFSWLDPVQKRESEVKSFLKEYYPEQFYQNDIDAYLDDFSISSVRHIFLEKYKNGGFDRTITEALIEQIRKRFSYFIRDYLQEIPFENEPEDQVAELAVLLMNEGVNISSILEKKPELFKRKEIINSFNVLTLRNVIGSNKELISPYLISLAKHNHNKETLTEISKYIPFSTVLEMPDIQNIITDEVLYAHIDDYNVADIKNARRYVELVEKKGSRSILSEIIANMIEKDVLFSLWWSALSDRSKITSLLILSSMTEKLKLSEKFLNAYNKESMIVGATMLLLKTFFVFSNSEKQRIFETAHYMYIKYIANLFNTDMCVSSALDELLDKCQTPYCYDMYYYCDGRPWKNINAIYCPEGVGHQCARNKCTYFNSLDYANTKYSKTGKAEHISLSDLLRNINFDPDLSVIKEEVEASDKTPWRYGFLLAGYVNQLIQMKPHMKCSCGQVFRPNFTYAKKFNAKVSPTIYDCPNNGENHDKNVYLNFCIRCHQIIDSRECEHKDSEGYWICMNCGGSKQYGGDENQYVCPHCLCSDTSMLVVTGGNRIVCKACGHNQTEQSWRKFPLIEV